MFALLKWLLVKHSTTLVIPSVMAFSYWLAGIVQDWNARLIIMFGVGGIAGIILSVARLRVASATARKIDTDTSASQWVLIIENLHSIITTEQEQIKGLSERLGKAQAKEDIITFSKHEAVKHNQAMIFHIQNTKELIALHNQSRPECRIALPPFNFTPLTDILRAEDETRLRQSQAVLT